MAVESTVSPEHHSLSYVQHRGRYDEVQKYQNARKRSSKDFYPPLMASVRRFSVRIGDGETEQTLSHTDNVLGFVAFQMSNIGKEVRITLLHC